MNEDATIVPTEKTVDWALVCNNLRLGWAHAIRCTNKAGIPPKYRRETVEFVATGKCLDVLIRCARSWDPARGFKFSTYVYRALGRGVFAHDCFASQRRPVPLDDAIGSVFDGRAIEETESRNMLHGILAKLGDEDRLVLLMRYWRKMTFPQIGAAFGRSRVTGNNMVTRALKAARLAATTGELAK